MSIVDEFRSNPSPPSRDGGALSLAIGVAAAFARGVGLVWGWNAHGHRLGAAPAAQAHAAIAPKPATIAASDARLGRARASRLLSACLGGEVLGALHPEMGKGDPGAFYDLMRAGDLGVRIMDVAGAPHSSAIVSPFLAPVAECALARGAALCEPDNRALAVETVGELVVQFGRAEARLAKVPPMERFEQERRVDVRAKARALNALAEQARAGRLILSDFGWFPHPEVVEIFVKHKPHRDGCAKA